MPRFGTHKPVLLVGVAVAGAIGAVSLWGAGDVLAWAGGLGAAAITAYVGQELPRQAIAALKRRRLRGEQATAMPITVTVKVKDQDYVVLADGDDVVEVPASGHTVRLVVTGARSLPVVLTELRAEIISRHDRSGDLSQHAAEIPLRRFEVILDTDPPVVRVLGSSDFPYEVKPGESEVFDLLIRVESGDVRWVLWLDWSSGGRTGSTRVDLDGHEFRTAARYPRRAA